MEDINVKQWQINFANNEYERNDFKTQVKAGWYDWFCKTESLRNKTYRMGKIISQIKPNGKIDLDNWYVWFKNNCPLDGPLYDDFRFARLSDGEVQFTIQIDCCWSEYKYCVYGRKNNFKEPLFECYTSRELVKWLNEKWDE